MEFPTDYNEENWRGLIVVMLLLSILIVFAEGAAVIPMIHPIF